MRRKVKMFSDEEEELLRLLKKRGARAERIFECEEDWVPEREEEDYEFCC